MDKELIEQVARALARNDCGSDPDQPIIPLPGDNKQFVWQLYADDAKVAIAAIAATQGTADNARISELVDAGRFLLARIDELDWSLPMDDFAREHAGHVDPAIERFRAILEGKAS